MTDLKDYIEEFNEKLQAQQIYEAHEVVKKAVRDYMGVKVEQENLREFLDRVLIKYGEQELGLKAEIMATLELLSLIMNDLTAAGVMDEQLEKLGGELPSNVTLIRKLYKSRVDTKGTVFSLQEIKKLSYMGHYYQLKDTPLIIMESLEPIQQLVAKYYDDGMYILSVLEDKTNLLQDVNYSTSKPEEIEIYQEIYQGEL